MPEKYLFEGGAGYMHVSQKSLDKEELQGFAIADPYAPFVFVNSQDWDAPQLFTLIHELAHLWIAATGISNNIELDSLNSNPVEKFCNEVAANVLMPESLMRSLDHRVFTDSKSIYKHAKYLGVSSFAFLVRSLKLALISTSKYLSLKSEVQHVNRPCYE